MTTENNSTTPKTLRVSSSRLGNVSIEKEIKDTTMSTCINIEKIFPCLVDTSIKFIKFFFNIVAYLLFSSITTRVGVSFPLIILSVPFATAFIVSVITEISNVSASSLG